jgi:DNA invertase Pin-like site-specific DNA recombinase
VTRKKSSMKPSVQVASEPSPPARVFAYGRVSTGHQQTSLQAQEQRLLGYVEWRLKALGCTYLGYFADEEVSGRVPFRQRKAGKVVYDSVQPGDHIIFTKPDRAFRNMGDTFATLDHWEKMGVYCHFVEYGLDTSNPMGRLMVAFLSIFAEFERSLNRERVKAVLAEKERQGLVHKPSPPHGFMVKKTPTGERKLGHDIYHRVWVVNDYELRLMRRIYLMRCNGETLRSIGNKLFEAKIPNRKGVKKWSLMTVSTYAQEYEILLHSGKMPAGYGLDENPAAALEAPLEASAEKPGNSESQPPNANTASPSTPLPSPGTTAENCST